MQESVEQVWPLLALQYAIACFSSQSAGSTALSTWKALGAVVKAHR